MKRNRDNKKEAKKAFFAKTRQKGHPPYSWIMSNEWKFNTIKFIDFKDYDKITQFWLFVENDVIDKIKNEFPQLSFLKWGKYGADVILSNTGKGDGIKKVIEIMNYDFNNTYAFGDGENDVSMFKAVKYSIAMGNGCDYAKDNATYITDRIENDGLANAINKYILNKK